MGPQMGRDLRVLTTVIPIAIHGAGPGLSLWFGSAEATGERRRGREGPMEGCLLTTASLQGVLLGMKVEPEAPHDGQGGEGAAGGHPGRAGGG